MTLAAPYPPELVRVARKVVWYNSPEAALADLPDFLTHLMVYGSSMDVAAVEQLFRWRNSGRSWRRLLLEYLRRKFGSDGTRDLEYPYHRCRDAGFRTARSVRRRVDSSAGREPYMPGTSSSVPLGRSKCSNSHARQRCARLPRFVSTFRVFNNLEILLFASKQHPRAVNVRGFATVDGGIMLRSGRVAGIRSS